MSLDDRQTSDAQPGAMRAGAADSTASGTLSGAGVASPGVGTSTDPKAVAAATSGAGADVGSSGEPSAPSSPMDRPEVVVGAAFGGAYLIARILKRLFD